MVDLFLPKYTVMKPTFVKCFAADKELSCSVTFIFTANLYVQMFLLLLVVVLLYRWENRGSERLSSLTTLRLSQCLQKLLNTIAQYCGFQCSNKTDQDIFQWLDINLSFLPSVGVQLIFLSIIFFNLNIILRSFSTCLSDIHFCSPFVYYLLRARVIF